MLREDIRRFAMLWIIPGVMAALCMVYLFLTHANPRKSWVAQYKYAHRGLHGGDVPENSLRAFEAAAAARYAIELDVHLLRDGRVIVFHDNNVRRMTGVDRQIADFSWDELCTLRLAGGEDGIPLFEEVLQTVRGRVPLLVEIKSRGRAGMLEEKTCALLKEYKGMYAVQSFSPFSIHWFARNAPQVPRGQLSSRFQRRDSSIPVPPGYQAFALKNLLVNFYSRPDFISYDIDSLPICVVSRLRKRGMRVLAWTVQNAEQLKKAKKYCDSIIFEKILP